MSEIKICEVCNKNFIPWFDGIEMENKICRLCDDDELAQMEFDRDNFGDS